jgi:hypothetical protein
MAKKDGIHMHRYICIISKKYAYEVLEEATE